MSANDRQVAGTHYQTALQPWDVFLEAYGLGFHICNAVKYLSRWKNKNGIEDLKKAHHYLQKIIECAKDGWPNPTQLDVDGRILKDLVAKLVAANNIGTTEFVIIDHLFRWSSLSHLMQANLFLEDLILRNGGTLD